MRLFKRRGRAEATPMPHNPLREALRIAQSAQDILWDEDAGESPEALQRLDSLLTDAMKAWDAYFEALHLGIDIEPRRTR